MKKLLFGSVFFSLLLLNGCQTEEPQNENVENIYEIGGADAEAALLTAHALTPTGLEFINPPLFMATVGSAAIIASAQQAFVLFRHTNTIALDGVTELDEKYILPNNPYESIGIGHNKGLSTLSTLGRQITNSDLQQDRFMLGLINSFGDFSVQQQQDILASIKNGQAYQIMLSNANLIIGNNGNVSLLPNINDAHRTYIANFIIELKAMDKSKDFKERLYNKINRNISELLAKEDSSNNILLIYLTVFKHSYEYWY